jgi:hypothetical protein
MDAELARGVGGCGNDTAFVGPSADDDGLAFEGRVEELFHRDEEGIHIDVEVGSHAKRFPFMVGQTIAVCGLSRT